MEKLVTIKHKLENWYIRIPRDEAQALIREYGNEIFCYSTKNAYDSWKKNQKIKFHNKIKMSPFGTSMRTYRRLIKQMGKKRVKNNRRRTNGRNVQVIKLNDGGTKVIRHAV